MTVGASIDVYAEDVLRELPEHVHGINANAFADAAFDRRTGTYVERLRELGVKAVRWPGGWKADALLWAPPPFDDATSPAPARVGPNEWPSGDRRMLEDTGRWVALPLGFDRMAELCGELGAAPTCVVTYSSVHWERSDGGSALELGDVIEAAEAWVRYARRRGIPVASWEIGNETYLGGSEGGMRYRPTDPDVYGRESAMIARRMRAADPSIAIGVNGHERAWWNTVLGHVADEVDFLVVHTYPCHGWTSFDGYPDRVPDACAPVETAYAALRSLGPEPARRIAIRVTEYAAGSFNAWDEAGLDTAHALLTADILGQLLGHPRVEVAQFWNTINNYVQPHESPFCAFARDGGLTPVGRALAMWGDVLGDRMLRCRAPAGLRAFATARDACTPACLVINPASSRATVEIEIHGCVSERTWHVEWLTGRSPADPAPTRGSGSLHAPGTSVVVELHPCSITTVAPLVRR